MNTDQIKNALSRRQFLQHAGSAAVALSSISSAESLAEEVSAPAPQSLLGRTGVTVSRLGIGCAQFQLAQVTVEDVRTVLHRALELGVHYLDVAPNYGNERIGFSEVKMGPTIPEIRDRVFLVTKTEEPTYDGTWRSIRRSMKRLRTDYLDLVHLHNFGMESRFSDLKTVLGKEGALGALREAKKQGAIRFIGASGHLFPSRFHSVLDTGEIDVLMNAVNFVNQHTYDFEHKVWSRAARENLGLVAMKVLGGGMGHGFRLPNEYYERAIRYALSVPAISAAVIGMKDVSELEAAAKVVARAAPLTPEESHRLSLAGLKLAGEEDWQAAYGQPLT